MVSNVDARWRLVLWLSGINLLLLAACGTIGSTTQSKASSSTPENLYHNALAHSSETFLKQQRLLSWKADGTREQLLAWQTKARGKLKTLLGFQPNVPAEYQLKVLAKTTFAKFDRLEIEYTLEAGLRTSAFVYLPKQTPKGTVILWHGHSHGAKNAVAGIAPYLKDKDQHRAAAHDLAKESYLVIAPELRTFGKSGSYVEHVILSGTMLMHGTSFVGKMVADSFRTVDLLEDHFQAPMEKLAVAGLGLGGQVAMFHAALDPRIDFTVVQGFLSSYRGIFLKSQHDICQYIPGFSKFFDKSDVGLMIAPRPSLYVSGHHDQMFPIDEANLEYRKIYSGYELFDQPERILLHRHGRRDGWLHQPVVKWLEQRDGGHSSVK